MSPQGPLDRRKKPRVRVKNFEVVELLSREAFEQLEELLRELSEQASEGVPIIVEGADDIKAMKRLGVENCVYKASNGKSLLNFIEEFSGKERVIILTDFDRTGEKLAKFFVKHARQVGVEPITEFRDRLKLLVRKSVKDIEGLAKFVHRERSSASI
jgi:5S rRNA maturation endonuclease (ribonuclease M5)